jgi:hypothetical protein
MPFTLKVCTKKKQQKNNNLSFTCEEGSQKVVVQIVKSKIPLKENATEGVKFFIPE